MVPTEETWPASAARSRRAQCCEDDCSGGARNRYFVGKRLTPDAMRLEQRYLNERRHLINRAVHGHGVVYGFAVGPMPAAAYERDAHTGRLRIAPGLAFDAAGRELVLTDILDLPLASVMLLDVDGKVVDSVDPKRGPCWLLRAHYAEQDRAPVTTRDSCRCETHEWDQVCETVRFSLQPVDCAACCAEPACELKCGCAHGPCCGDAPADPNEQADAKAEPACNPAQRGGCQCLCEHLGGLEPGVECTQLYAAEESCGHVRVDLRHGVALACVSLRRDDCGGWAFDGQIEACGPRRLVKRNDLLFDLIRGCDLTRICAIGWAPWHRATADWAEFVASFGEEEAGTGQSPTAAYWIDFSRPVRADSLKPDCFAITVVLPEAEGGWRHLLRVPIVDVRTLAGSNLPPHLASRAQLVVDTAWVNDALVSARTRFGAGAEVEIEVRGDYITDCNGQQVDANARGRSPAPTGNGTPGGTFVSTFSVAPKPVKAASAQGVKS